MKETRRAKRINLQFTWAFCTTQKSIICHTAFNSIITNKSRNQQTEFSLRPEIEKSPDYTGPEENKFITDLFLSLFFLIAMSLKKRWEKPLHCSASYQQIWQTLLHKQLQKYSWVHVFKKKKKENVIAVEYFTSNIKLLILTTVPHKCVPTLKEVRLTLGPRATNSMKALLPTA